MQDNEYSNGNVQAVLTPEQTRASWGRGDYSGARIQLINEAFRLFYRYRTRIERVSHKDWDTYWAMLRELEDAGDTGWGLGVQDLDNAFRHLTANNGNWTDETTRAYWERTCRRSIPHRCSTRRPQAPIFSPRSTGS
ncbi:MAG: hypothetical protein ACP5U2_11715 [Bryobacteraceae bacterium]